MDWVRSRVRPDEIMSYDSQNRRNGPAPADFPITFSVLITCHNQEKFIADAISSALTQTVPALEVIVVDDLSTDNSAGAIAGHGDAIRFIRNETNLRANRSRNLAASMARGEYLVFLDGDDFLMPWALQVYRQTIAETRTPLILAAMHFFKGDKPDISEMKQPDSVAFVEFESVAHKDRGARASASATVMAKKLFDAAGGWSPDIWPFEDIDLSLKTASLGKVALVVSPATVCYRLHDNNTINDLAGMKRGLLSLIGKEQEGRYPGGRTLKFRRMAYLGGPALYWFSRQTKAGCHGNAWQIFRKGWLFMAIAAAKQIRLKLTGRREPRVIPL